MSDYYVDSSALAKRYLSEAGTAWVRGLVEPAAGHAIWVAEITEVEVASALAARHRAPGGITRQVRDATVALLSLHCSDEYRLVALDRPILDAAVELTQRHRLRGYDAVQLATALAAHAALLAAGLPGLTFAAADADLIAAARAEGRTVAGDELARRPLYAPLAARQPHIVDVDVDLAHVHADHLAQRHGDLALDAPAQFEDVDVGVRDDGQVGVDHAVDDADPHAARLLARPAAQALEARVPRAHRGHARHAQRRPLDDLRQHDRRDHDPAEPRRLLDRAFRLRALARRRFAHGAPGGDDRR